VSEIKERELHSCFYTNSLNHKVTSSLLGQPKPSFNYIQNFTNHTPRLHFWTKKLTRFLTHKNLDTHATRITLTDLKSHQANN